MPNPLSSSPIDPALQCYHPQHNQSVAEPLVSEPPLNYTPAIPQDNTNVETSATIGPAPLSLVEDNEEQAQDTSASNKPTPASITGKHAAAMAVEQLAHKAGHKLAHKTVSRAAGKAAATAAARTTEHAVGHVAARGAGAIAGRAVPGVGAVVAGGLAVMSGIHAYEEAKEGDFGAAAAYAGAAAVDGVVAVVNAAGAATGVGTLISTPVSVGLGVVATGLAAAGAWLGSD